MRLSLGFTDIKYAKWFHVVLGWYLKSVLIELLKILVCMGTYECVCLEFESLPTGYLVQAIVCLASIG